MKYILTIMKNNINHLNNMKSVCFMLLSYLTLSIGITSCNQDEFENYEPEKQKKFSKAELIEQALKRMPQTRANGNLNMLIRMVTIKDTISIKCRVDDTVTFYWDNELSAQVTKETNTPQIYTFTDGRPSHFISVIGTDQALRDLDLCNNGIILLEVYSNKNLLYLYCNDNHLDEIDLTDCPNLQMLYVPNNELSSINVTNLSKLESFNASNNRLTKISFSQHPYMYELFVENNQLIDLDLSGISDLSTLTVQNNPLRNLNLKECLYLEFLDISSTPIKTLDLSHNTNLWEIRLENTSIEVLNNQFICGTSFSVFNKLERLNVAYTGLTSLDLSNMPRLTTLNISGSTITQLNLSNSNMFYRLYATRSKLTDLICTTGQLKNLYEVRIESTPLEKDLTKIEALGELLPFRTDTSPGHLYTYSLYVDNLFLYTIPKNWLINQ